MYNKSKWIDGSVELSVFLTHTRTIDWFRSVSPVFRQRILVYLGNIAGSSIAMTYDSAEIAFRCNLFMHSYAIDSLSMYKRNRMGYIARRLFLFFLSTSLSLYGQRFTCTPFFAWGCRQIDDGYALAFNRLMLSALFWCPDRRSIRNRKAYIKKKKKAYSVRIRK